MATFGERFRQLRSEKRLTQEQLAKIFYTNKGSISKYEHDKQVPEIDVLKKYADFFGVSVDYLLGRSDIRNPDRPWQPVITPKDERDIAKDLERIMNDLSQADGLMFYNEPMTEEDKQLIKEAIEFGLRVAKMRNKERFTPKKYRNKK